jgi:hypothetical protein
MAAADYRRRRPKVPPIDFVSGIVDSGGEAIEICHAAARAMSNLRVTPDNCHRR